ncbi:MAG: cation diffusion facilitator family transporter [Chloroflexota bacterium]|nr:cation diffusion facilitator family transporter [Dehalococcoidia bacterium]MDW8252548.1 cation diffusion facilitator family transporter [Chloroflexota bacterium]
MADLDLRPDAARDRDQPSGPPHAGPPRLSHPDGSGEEHAQDHPPERSRGQRHGHEHSRGHHHGGVDPTIVTSQRGIWAVQISFAALFVTAAIQFVIALISGSVALLADTIHNVGDAATAIPLWIAFALARRAASRRFTYGFGRVEDLAGMIVVAVIGLSAVVAGYEAVVRLFDPQPVEHLGAVVLASIIGFAGNEAVAVFRIRVGKQINSAALIADGYHARADGLTSLAVLVGATGVALGFPIADPLVGLLISGLIVKILWDSAKAVFQRALDGVDPLEVELIRHALEHTPGVEEVGAIRARWIGHRLFAEAHVTVAAATPIEEAHAIAVEARHALFHHLPHLGDAVIHVDPPSASGAHHHRIEEHEHDGLPAHSHH